MADISKIKLADGTILDVKDATARSSLDAKANSVSPTLTGTVTMSGATTVTAPNIDYSTYDETTQGNCVVTMATMVQAMKAIMQSSINGTSLVLSSFDNIDGTTLVVN